MSTQPSAYQFNDTIHFGPVWDKPNRKLGQSYSACDDVAQGDVATLTTHKPSVTCPSCKAILSSSNTTK
jgi:hypothetical protein